MPEPATETASSQRPAPLAKVTPLSRSPGTALARDGDVEVGGAELPVEAQPERQVHLGPAGGADVAEIEDRVRQPAERRRAAPAPGLGVRRRSPQTKTRGRRGRGRGRPSPRQFIVFSALTTWVSGKAAWICSPRLSSLQTESVGGNPPEKSSGLATSTSTLPAQVRRARGLERRQRGVAGGAVEEQLAEAGGVGEGAARSPPRRPLRAHSTARLVAGRCASPSSPRGRAAASWSRARVRRRQFPAPRSSLLPSLWLETRRSG